jgi:hypothetical protein
MIWALLIMNVVLVAMLAWEKYQNRLERQKYLNAIIGKNAQEVASLNLADNTKIESRSKTKEDIMPIESMSEADFEKMIDKQNG